MSKFYQRFLLLFLLVCSISGVVIYTTVDINTLHNLTAFQPWSVALAVVSLSIGLVLDGTRLMHLVKVANEKITFKQAVHVVFGNYFLALLTPGATGGAVAQVMFLRHAGVPMGKATVLVIVRTLVSIFFLLCCMPFIFLHDAGILPGVDNETLMVVSLLLFLGIIGIVLASRTRSLDTLIGRITGRLSPHRKRVIVAFYRDIKIGVRLLAASPKSMVRIFFESGLSLLFIYGIVPCLLLGLGVTDADWYTVMGRMFFLNMLLYVSPTPGGSGIAEGGFVWLFADSVPAGTVGILAVSWRLIAEYIPFLIGFYYTIRVFGRDFLNQQLGK
ncbi:lysylphosphatidylglycerol synthase transmembrane domain-containing protein [Selenomonas sp. TAMA-11512]|uniref:lysylphosphatidylglycerol synthase transmembrane domain-containing protein n=1 Tax=Selenomonas sp. TAMA-11512 TaxID=3095337 RepID=UPI00309224A3|nr:lysylphosphatidylglycerol synthase transmembrane domain-containing protein [Selenomonas sp. TAMA-11512]